jgi:NTE family protein
MLFSPFRHLIDTFSVNKTSIFHSKLSTVKNIGLVLSGGGVRGIAHLGVIKVMQECGIEPDVISGTSAGAIAGALYAAGHSIDTIREVFTTTAIFRISNISRSKPGFIDTDKFYELLKKYLPDDDFGGLKKKLYITATDIINGRSKTFSEGPLIKPILASAAVPVVFTPVKIGKKLYTDGGALNNFPVEPLIGRCSAIIGSNVHPFKVIQPNEIKTSLKVMERLFHLAIHYHSLQKYHLCHVVISPMVELADFGVFDWANTEKIYEIGYQAASAKREQFLQLKSLDT